MNDDEPMTPEDIRAEAEALRYDIKRLEERLADAEDRLYELKMECKHPSLRRTGAVWPHTDDCPDCGMMFYLGSKDGAEECQ